MAKQKKKTKQSIICECCKCITSIERDNTLYCKTMILDLNKPFSSYSEVKIKNDCSYFREIRCN